MLHTSANAALPHSKAASSEVPLMPWVYVLLRCQAVTQQQTQFQVSVVISCFFQTSGWVSRKGNSCPSRVQLGDYSISASGVQT